MAESTTASAILEPASQGGRWDGGHFFYNRAVTNINVTNIHNVYNTTVINNTTVNRISYNGGKGGIDARATAEEEAAAHDRHVPAVAAQTQTCGGSALQPKATGVSKIMASPPLQPQTGLTNSKGTAWSRQKEAGAPYTPNRGEAGAGQRGQCRSSCKSSSCQGPDTATSGSSEYRGCQS